MFRFTTSRSRLILLVGVAASLFLLWLGLWGRVLSPRSRLAFPPLAKTKWESGDWIISEYGAHEAVSDDGRWVAVGRYRSFMSKSIGPLQPEVLGYQIWDMQTGACAAELACDTDRQGGHWSLRFAPDSKAAAVIKDSDAHVRLVELDGDVRWAASSKLVPARDVTWLDDTTQSDIATWTENGWVKNHRKWVAHCRKPGKGPLSTWQRCLGWLSVSESAKDPGSVSFYSPEGRFAGKIEGELYLLSEGETVVATRRPDGQVRIFDLPMRGPIEWQLILSAPPALLLTLLLRWRLAPRWRFGLV